MLNFQRRTGAGFFLNSSYELRQSLLIAEDDSHSNQHEFNIVNNGRRALVTTHDTKELPASDLGLDGDIWVRTDGFKEMNVQTGETVFEWATIEHVSLDESSLKNPGLKIDAFSKRHGWDAL